MMEPDNITITITKDGKKYNSCFVLHGKQDEILDFAKITIIEMLEQMK